MSAWINGFSASVRHRRSLNRLVPRVRRSIQRADYGHPASHPSPCAADPHGDASFALSDERVVAEPEEHFGDDLDDPRECDLYRWSNRPLHVRVIERTDRAAAFSRRPITAV